MDALHVMPELELRALRDDWDRLFSHLFPGDHDEHGAVLLCGEVRTSTRHRLVVREVIPASDGVDYVPGTRGYRHLTGAFVTQQLRKAKDLGLVYLAVHNHGGRGTVAFSAADFQSHERGYPTLLQVSGKAVGGLVVARGAVAGDVWLPDGGRIELAETAVIGHELLLMRDGQSPSAISQATTFGSEQHARQSLMFGDQGQRLLGRMRVAVVGAGGVGMLIVQALSRLGVGELVVVDPDVISISNLSRLPEARMSDAGLGPHRGFLGRLFRRPAAPPRRKVDLAKQIAQGANPHMRVEALAADVADDQVAQQLRDCDFIFLAADTMLARDVVNQIAFQFLIPTLQVGSKVVLDTDNGDVRDVFAVVRSLGSTPGCLRCNGLINVAKLTEEALDSDEQRKHQRYVDEPQIEAPSVITINAMGVGWAVNDFMQYATGIGRPDAGFRILRSKPVGATGQQLTVQTPDADPDCHVCGQGPYSAIARGDNFDLPTRIRA
jgi:hypothetical protein